MLRNPDVDMLKGRASYGTPPPLADFRSLSHRLDSQGHLFNSFLVPESGKDRFSFIQRRSLRPNVIFSS